MAGLKGTVLETLDPNGRVKVNGEIWNAVSTGGTINKGESVSVSEVKQFVLYVEKITT